MTKYIFITGGVSSSLGKGIIAASLGKLLKSRGYSVSCLKLDPYINIDPGTLNPYEHGECFVTDDGCETDLDLGHYERFLGVPTSKDNNVTQGKIYQAVIDRERKGDFLGKTVQIVPHITNEIKSTIRKFDDKFDFVICEIGGTVGDIESLPFLESLRQLKWDLGSQNHLVLHLTLVPYLASAGELKTKPSQHSVKELLSHGIQPDFLICRTERGLDSSIRSKLAQFCNIEGPNVIEATDAETIYDVPILMFKEGLDVKVLKKLGVNPNPIDLSEWKKFLWKLKNPEKKVRIGLVGKYTELKDAYKSIYESLVHASAVNETSLEIVTVDSDQFDDDMISKLDGVIIGPGFGSRGIDGKIRATKLCREGNIPTFGICLGMQCMCIEFARNVLGLRGANSTEFDKSTSHPVIDLMESQKENLEMGGTMRLGSYECQLLHGSKVGKIYGSDTVTERHRHRFEFNNDYSKDFESNGFKVSGMGKTHLVEAIELESHRWFIGVQFHPEYKSWVENPHPLFVDFVRECSE